MDINERNKLKTKLEYKNRYYRMNNYKNKK